MNEVKSVAQGGGKTVLTEQDFAVYRLCRQPTRKAGRTCIVCEKDSVGTRCVCLDCLDKSILVADGVYLSLASMDKE